jgi:hypothetical protein
VGKRRFRSCGGVSIDCNSCIFRLHEVGQATFVGQPDASFVRHKLAEVRTADVANRSKTIQPWLATSGRILAGYRAEQ